MSDNDNNPEAPQDNRRLEPAPAAETTRKSPIGWPWIGLTLLAVSALILVIVLRPAKAVGMNEAVGRMDGVSITKSELYDELLKRLPAGQAVSTLDSMMTFKLVELEAKQGGVTASDAEIQAEIADYKKNYPTDELFNADLQQSGMTLQSLHEQIGIQIKMRKIFEPRIKPTEAQLKSYYEKNKMSFSTPEQVRASHILLPTKAEAETVLAELQKGADFAALAKQKSTDTASKDQGGDLNFFGRGRMNEPFETAAFKLKKGETSNVVESPNGFHIIKLTDRKSAVTPTFDAAKLRVKNRYLDEQMQSLIPDWVNEQKKAYHYENLLAQPSTPAPTASASANP